MSQERDRRLDEILDGGAAGASAEEQRLAAMRAAMKQLQVSESSGVRFDDVMRRVRTETPQPTGLVRPWSQWLKRGAVLVPVAASVIVAVLMFRGSAGEPATNTPAIARVEPTTTAPSTGRSVTESVPEIARAATAEPESVVTDSRPFVRVPRERGVERVRRATNERPRPMLAMADTGLRKSANGAEATLESAPAATLAMEGAPMVAAIPGGQSVARGSGRTEMNPLAVGEADTSADEETVIVVTSRRDAKTGISVAQEVEPTENVEFGG